MNNEFDIEILDDEDAVAAEETVEEPAREQLPLNFIAFGEVARDDVRVYIKQDVYKALEELAASDTEKELGSILLGSYCEEQGRTHVVISAYVEAKYTDASAATLTFTHDTWEYVHAERAEKYPDLKIVGWQHTHPSYGIFLSNYDMFIQENFFDLPFQVAYVIDPVQHLRGFFQWKKNKVEKLGGYYIYDEVGETIALERPKSPKTDAAVAKPSKTVGVLLTLLTVAVFSLSQQYREQVQWREALEADLTSYQTALFNQQMTVYELQSVVNEQKTAIEKQAALLAQLQQTAPNEVRFTAYTVAVGDSLSSICTAHGLDYAAVYRIVLAVNGIDDPDQIYVGQTILLPLAQ